MLNKILNWNERTITKWIDLLELEPYQIYLASFFKGVILVLLIQWLI